MSKEIRDRVVSRRDIVKVFVKVTPLLLLKACLTDEPVIEEVSAKENLSNSVSTPTPLPTSSAIIEPEPTVEPIVEEPTIEGYKPTPPLISENSYILPIPTDSQDYSLSCESSAAGMVASYFRPYPPAGYSSWETYFVDTIPKDCNPHKGFRGLISGRLSTSCDEESGLGYGVYAEPVANAFLKAGITAKAEYYVNYDWVEKQIRKSRPVLVWVSFKTRPSEYELDTDIGKEYILLYGEHVLAVIGIREEGGNKQFLVNDPESMEQYWVSHFPRWDEFNNMSVVVGP